MSGVIEPSLSEASPASAALPFGSADGHVVQFYAHDDELANAVADFMGEGLAAGDVVVAIAVEAHARAFRDRLRSQGVQVEEACASGQLVFLDASSTLSRFTRDGDPDPQLFDSVVGELIEEVAARAKGARVRAYGEMVDVLWQRGERKGAVRLEELWNDLRARRSFTLLCAYAMAGFYKEPEAARLVCRTHTRVAGSGHRSAAAAGRDAGAGDRAPRGDRTRSPRNAARPAHQGRGAPAQRRRAARHAGERLPRASPRRSRRHHLVGQSG